jgi:hypothetical protein
MELLSQAESDNAFPQPENDSYPAEDLLPQEILREFEGVNACGTSLRLPFHLYSN